MRPGSSASETSLTAATPPKLLRTRSTESTGGIAYAPARLAYSRCPSRVTTTS